MANSKTGTSTSNTLGNEYQVFLSFRGPDTRHGFTDFLHQALEDVGIRVFIDDAELQPGETISGNLLRAIDDSKLYIPIFSKKYASSHWCLRELARMVDNTAKSKEDGKEKVILPIFYDVEPDDVKLKTELYKKAISKLKREKKLSSKDVEKWQQALKEVGHIKGLKLKKYSSHAELTRAVVSKVVVQLKTRQRDVTEYLVGMEDRVAAINNLLKVESVDVRLIGIYGMGGIGKTTLAKIIYNEQCPRFQKNCSFLDDVRETAKTMGLVKLQKQLLSDISSSMAAQNIGHVDHGTKAIGDIICNRKVLIVLDDVGESNQIQELIGSSLHSGTRILVTTRDENVLKIREFNHKILSYEMEGLSRKDALKLFSKHAFNDSSPPLKYYTLSKDIVSTTGGLPLALVVIGSMLSRIENTKIWEEKLEKLRKTPHEDVLGKLRISYDTLNTDQQQIFLDISCFFIGENKTNPMYMWNDCKYCPEHTIEVLIKRCMIKVFNDDKFWMHDQLRVLGRAIAIKDGTRLWDKDDIICKLRSTEINGSVQALRLASSWERGQPPIIVTSEQIKRFPHLRFLSLHTVICQGDFTGCLFELKWISLRYPYSYPGRSMATRRQWFEATDSLQLEKVVVVNLSGLDITEDVFESLIKGARKLKVLSIQYNRSIHGIPTFPKYSILEKLTISKFVSLMEIDCSIGKLGRLIDLSFNSCAQLDKLPEQIGELRNLQHLSLESCDLIELPDSILQLELLTKLDVSGTSIKRLPDSIGRLSSLSYVDVSYTPIEELPSTMSKLLHLQTLHLNHCNMIQKLPELPRSLITLRLTSASLITVPNLSCFTNLVELALSDVSESMAKSNKIQPCDLQWIRSLSKLSKLHFCFSNVCAPATELGSLSLLELTLHGLDVPTFKQLPSELIVLELYDTRGKQIQVPPPEEETVFVSSSSRELAEEKARKQLELKFFKEFGTSERLVCLREQPGCNELQAPELIDHWRGAFHFPSSLKMIRKFVLWGCPGVQDIQFVSMLESLLVFSVGGCTSLKSLGGLSNLKYLMELTLNRCWSLQVVEGIDELEFLNQLQIIKCRSVGRILDPWSSKIPAECLILITSGGELPDCGQTYFPWKAYREKILMEQSER